jgi:hypothetical protein
MIAMTTCQLRESAPSQEEKMKESEETAITITVENLRIIEKVSNLALSITSTLARFLAIYAKMRA